jgi:hypothetical protein
MNYVCISYSYIHILLFFRVQSWSIGVGWDWIELNRTDGYDEHTVVGSFISGLYIAFWVSRLLG